MNNYNEEKQNVIDWLCHPSELGKAPAKIEFTKEFTDADGFQAFVLMENPDWNPEKFEEI